MLYEINLIKFLYVGNIVDKYLNNVDYKIKWHNWKV
jgi:hypothetical protein